MTRTTAATPIAMIARTTYHRYAIGMSSRPPFICFFMLLPSLAIADKDEKAAIIFNPLKTETQSEMRPSPAYEHYAQTEAHGCCYPQHRHI